MYCSLYKDTIQYNTPRSRKLKPRSAVKLYSTVSVILEASFWTSNCLSDSSKSRGEKWAKQRARKTQKVLPILSPFAENEMGVHDSSQKRAGNSVTKKAVKLQPAAVQHSRTERMFTLLANLRLDCLFSELTGSVVKLSSDFELGLSSAKHIKTTFVHTPHTQHMVKQHIICT